MNYDTLYDEAIMKMETYFVGFYENEKYNKQIIEKLEREVSHYSNKLDKYLNGLYCKNSCDDIYAKYEDDTFKILDCIYDAINPKNVEREKDITSFESDFNELRNIVKSSVKKYNKQSGNVYDIFYSKIPFEFNYPYDQRYEDFLISLRKLYVNMDHLYSHREEAITNFLDEIMLLNDSKENHNILYERIYMEMVEQEKQEEQKINKLNQTKFS